MTSSTNPFRFSIGAVGFVDLTPFDAEPMFVGSFKIPNRFVKNGSDCQLTRVELGELMLQAMEQELGDFEAYLDEMRGATLPLPFGVKGA